MKKTNYKSNKSFMYNCPFIKPTCTFNKDKVKVFRSKISHNAIKEFEGGNNDTK